MFIDSWLLETGIGRARNVRSEAMLKQRRFHKMDVRPCQNTNNKNVSIALPRRTGTVLKLPSRCHKIWNPETICDDKASIRW